MPRNEQQLSALPEKQGFRLRGTEMTRLETFTDAAFAFAATMLVISIGNIPGSYGELMEALKGVPAFAASFLVIMAFWAGHRKWSRRYGLEDLPSIVITLGLVFVMMVYVYPLKAVFSGLFMWISRGWLPSEFAITKLHELLGLFIVYGLGFAAMGAMMAILYRRAEVASDVLDLNALERLRTREEVVSWAALALTGLGSAAFARLMPGTTGFYAGFVYAILGVIMPAIAIRYDRKAKEMLQDD